MVNKKDDSFENRLQECLYFYVKESLRTVARYMHAMHINCLNKT